MIEPYPATMASTALPEIIELASIDSTSMEARRRLAAGWRPPAHGAALCAAEQTGGVGRLGRVWASPAGGLYITLVVAAPPSVVRGPISLAVGLAVLSAVEALAPPLALALRLKWPNDLMLAGRKLGGVLVENVAVGGERWLVVGVGVNANTNLAALPAEVRQRAGSMAADLGAPVDLPLLRHRTIAAVAPVLAGSGAPAALIDAVRARLAPGVGEHAVVRLPDGATIVGTVADLSPEGSLVLALADGTTRAITSGEVGAAAAS